MATLDDIAAALVVGNVGSATAGQDWFIFKGYMPDGDAGEIPDKAFCLYEPPGEAPLERGTLIYPHCQVKGRGGENGYEELRAKMDAVFSVLHGGEAAIGGAYVYSLAQHTGCVPMGFDNRRRPMLAMNFRLCKRTL